MCSNCKSIYGRKAFKHDPINCPIQYYCSICARTCNHTTLRCPDKDALRLRRPTCLEQLIPGSVLDAYGVCSITPLPDPLFEMEPLHTPVLEVVDTDKDIRAKLTQYGKSDKGKMKDLRSRLMKTADDHGLKLVYVKPMVLAE